jgi:hypothetical protein
MPQKAIPKMKCRNCGGTCFVRQGKTVADNQRYLCKDCSHRQVEEPIQQARVTEEKITTQERGNTLLIDLKTRREAWTKDALLKRCGVDTTVWEVDKYTINVWEQASKGKDPDELRVVPLFQVKLSLIRKVPVQQAYPIIHPVMIPASNLPVAQPRKRTHYAKGLALVIMDSQNGYKRRQNGYLDPYHDRRIWDINLKLAAAYRPEKIILVGDMLDVPDWSDRFTRYPDEKGTMQAALDELAWWIAQLRKASPGSEVHYIEGNHENRVSTFLAKYNEQAWGIRQANRPDSPPVLSVPFMLGLKGMDVRYHGDYPKGQVWLNDNFAVKHGEVVRTQSGKSTAAIVNETRVSKGVGHIHRLELASKTIYGKRGPVTYVAASFGTGARIDGPIPAAGTDLNWQNGTGFVEYEPGNGMYNVIPILIVDGECLYQGKRWTGVDHVKRIAHDTKHPEFNLPT